jgi:hypothetical protein
MMQLIALLQDQARAALVKDQFTLIGEKLQAQGQPSYRQSSA